MIIGVPVVRGRGDKIYLSTHFGRAPLFAFIEVSGRDYRIVSIEENPAARERERGVRGQRVVEFLSRHGVEAVITREVGPGAFYRLRESGIKVYTPVIENRGLVELEEVLRAFIEGRVSELTGPTEE